MTKPECPYFGACGGCASQDIPYDDQLASKLGLVREAVGFPNTVMYSGDAYKYRNRVDMVFHEGGLGFRRKGRWHDVVDIEQCAISNEVINRLISEIREYFAGVDSFHLRKQIGTYRHALIRATKIDSAVSIVLNSDSDRLHEAKERVESFAKYTSASNVLITYIGKESGSSISDTYDIVKGSDMMVEEYLGKKFLFSVQGFFQTNSTMAEKIHEYCTNLLSKYDTKEGELLDLYGGVGTFGILNSRLFKHTSTVENFPACVQAAKRNIYENGVENIQAHLLDAKDTTSFGADRSLFVIVDPPRSGMHPNALKTLKSLAPDVILYVSCNPKLLKEDLPRLSEYEIKSAAAFDLFPHTPHVEAVVELVRTTVL